MRNSSAKSWGSARLKKPITFGENMPTHRPLVHPPIVLFGSNDKCFTRPHSKITATSTIPIFTPNIPDIPPGFDIKMLVNFILPSGKSIFCHLRTVVITLWVGYLFDHKNSTRNPRWLTTPYRQKYANLGKRIIKNPPKDQSWDQHFKEKNRWESTI